MPMNRFFLFFTLFLLPLAACRSHKDAELPIASLLVSAGDTLQACDWVPTLRNVKSLRSDDCSVERLDSAAFVVGCTKLGPLNLLSLACGSERFDLVLIDASRPRSRERIATAGADGGCIRLEWTRRPDRLVALWQNERIEVRGDTLRIPSRARRVGHSVLRVWGECDGAVTNDLWIPLFRGEAVRDARQLARTDPRRMVIYSLMIDRFANGNPDNDAPLGREDVLPTVDWQGGDFAGITQKIDEGFFSELGMNTLWITPIAKNADGAWGLDTLPFTRFSAYHGYWPTDPTRLEERFGSEAELRTMLDRAHGRGMNVLVDLVANHLHRDSHLLLEHPDWPTDMYLPDGRPNVRLFDEERLTTWFDTFLPTLDLSRPEVAGPMTDSALYWLERFDFDGFRHDAAKHIDKRYWRMLTRKIRTRIGRPVFQIGETYGPHPLVRSYVNSGMLDAQFDFALFHVAQNAFGTGRADMAELGEALLLSLENYGFHHVMGNITGNHDKPRFISVAGGAVSLDEDTKAAGRRRKIEVGDTMAYRKLSLLEAFQFTVPGIPCVYYGDDYGVPGGNDPDNRKMMQFSGYDAREQGVRERLCRLARLRSERMPLLYGDLTHLEAGPGTLSFRRTYLGESVVVLFNNGAEARTLRCAFRSEQPLRPNFGGRLERGADSLAVRLEPYSFEILTIR